MDALEIKGLRKEYPGFCLDGLDLELPRGCIMGSSEKTAREKARR